jgi:hypothetical protein
MRVPMDNTVFIHFGPAKTGSTAIQRFFTTNDGLLSRKGFHYIKALRYDKESASYGSHNPLVWILYHRHFDEHLNTVALPFVTKQNEYLGELSDEIHRHSDQSLILSSEIFPMLDRKGLDELLDFFTGRPIKPIIYIRDIRSQLISLAASIVKFHETGSDDRLSNIYANHLHYFHSYFLNCLKVLTQRLGKSNLIFRKYGSEYFHYGNIFADILNAIGLKLTNDFILPSGLQNESLKYCETVYFKDLINRLRLATPENFLGDKLLDWEKSHKGTPFYLSKYTSTKIEDDVQNIKNTLLANYLDETYEQVIDKSEPLDNIVDYELPYAVLINILDYLDCTISGLKANFTRALSGALERTYDYEAKFREFEDTFLRLFQSGKPVALWGCGGIADKLFNRHEFLRVASLEVVDANTEKQGGRFWGHTILPPSIIADKCIDTVIITSFAYADEICETISGQYPCVRHIVKLSDLKVQIGIEFIDFDSDKNAQLSLSKIPGEEYERSYLSNY